MQSDIIFNFSLATTAKYCSVYPDVIPVLNRKMVLEMILKNVTQKLSFYVTSGQAHLKNSIIVTTVKVSGGQKLFKIVSYV